MNYRTHPRKETWNSFTKGMRKPQLPQLGWVNLIERKREPRESVRDRERVEERDSEGGRERANESGSDFFSEERTSNVSSLSRKLSSLSIYIHTYIYIYIERERARERDRSSFLN